MVVVLRDGQGEVLGCVRECKGRFSVALQGWGVLRCVAVSLKKKKLKNPPRKR